MTDPKYKAYKIDRSMVESFCLCNMIVHTDWTGDRVETVSECESLEKFVDRLMNYIIDHQPENQL